MMRLIINYLFIYSKQLFDGVTIIIINTFILILYKY